MEEMENIFTHKINTALKLLRLYGHWLMCACVHVHTHTHTGMQILLMEYTLGTWKRLNRN